MARGRKDTRISGPGDNPYCKRGPVDCSIESGPNGSRPPRKKKLAAPLAFAPRYQGRKGVYNADQLISEIAPSASSYLENSRRRFAVVARGIHVAVWSGHVTKGDRLVTLLDATPARWQRIATLLSRP